MKENKEHNYGSIGDFWLREHGVVHPRVHETLSYVIKVRFTKIKDFEYICDSNTRKVQVNLYMGFWSSLFSKTSSMVDFIYDLLLENLPEYQVGVSLKRYKKSKGSVNA